MKLKRCFAGVALALSLMVVCMPEAPVRAASNDGAVVQPCVNKTQWYYRTYNGKRQRRLWSITYEKWMTDWMYY